MKGPKQGIDTNTVCTTVRVRQGIPEFWSLHLVRLQYFATVLNIELDASVLNCQVLQHSSVIYDGALRIQLALDGAVEFSSRKIPSPRALSFRRVSSHRTVVQSRMKWVERSAWNSLKQDYGVDILVLCDDDNRYLECCIGNLFIYRPFEEQWYTPHIELPILAGIMRSVILSQLPTGTVIEARIVPHRDDELWMSNALRGCCPLLGAKQPPPVFDDAVWSEQIEAQALQHFTATIAGF